MPFEKATREKTKLRIALMGPTNSGKTFGGMRIGKGVIQAAMDAAEQEYTEEDIFEKMAVIDTERRRSKFYADRDDLPMSTKQFYFMDLTPPYDPNRYISAIKEAEELVGPEGVIIVDSLTHAWSGTGGVLDIKQRIEKQKNKNSYTAWADASKEQNKLIDVLMSVDCHIIVTMRSKMHYEIKEDDTTKRNKVEQLGLKPIQRDDTEYEFDITLMLEKTNNSAYITKDTTFLKSIADDEDNIGILDENLGKRLYRWLNEGINTVDILEEERLEKIAEIKQRAKENPELKTLYKTKLHPEKKSDELSLAEARTTIEAFYRYLRKNPGGDE